MASPSAPRRRRRPASSGGVRWDKVSRIALLSTLGVILLAYLSPAKHWWQATNTARDQGAQLQELTRENQRLTRRMNTLRDPGALELEARKLGMVREGERSYVIQRP